ncbi:MAG TPA: restriction endonuclease subunit S [Dehalococcoidia bacterium]|nr:restriction endonuclease subunit S [Dehalococcoidia bacterium]
MEVKPGYKQTEVGVIPEEWAVMSLGDFGELTSSKRIFESDYVPVGVPFFRGKEISRLVEGEAIDDPYFISQERFNSLKTRFGAPARGDILITAVGTLGNVYVVDTDEPFYFKDGNLIWLRNIHYVDPEFLGVQLRRAKTAILDSAIGSSQKALTIVVLRRLSVAIPPLPEQRAIATALSDVDALLGGLDRLIAKKRDLKQSAMQQLLTGQTRLPGFHGEWEMKRLGDIAHIKTGSRNNEDKVEDGEYPFFVRSEIVERINSYSHDCEAILVPGEGRIGDIFHYINGRFDVHQRVYAITQFKPGMSAKFVHFYMALRFGDWAMQNTVKATVDSLRLPTFQTFEMRVPPTREEQAAIAVVLSDMDAELSALEARRDKTRNLKQAMMQELLTGRTRLV